MSGEDNQRPSKPTAQATGKVDFTPWFVNERAQLVIVVPDSMQTQPPDLAWIDEHNPFGCRIIKLGKPKGSVRYETTEPLYRDLLRQMIAAGVRVIHGDSLEKVNADYLARHPDAEGVPIWRPKRHQG